MSLTQFKGYFYLWNAIIKQWRDETKTKNILLVTAIIEVSLEKDCYMVTRLLEDCRCI